MPMIRRQVSWLVNIAKDELGKKAFWALIALVIVIAGIAIRQAHRITPSLPVEAGLASALVVVLITWFARTIYGRRSFRHAYYPKVRFHYEVLEKSIEYEIDDKDTLHFARRVRLRSLVDNLESYMDKYVWTGGPSGLPTAGDGASSTERILRAGIWTFYHTYFPYPLRRGQEHEFVVHWPPLTNWRNSSPFVSTSTEEPTRRLRFFVQIPETALGSAVALAEELRGIESAYPFTTERLSFDRGRMEWVLHPKLYRHYRLRWSWSHGEDLHLMPSQSAEEASGS